MSELEIVGAAALLIVLVAYFTGRHRGVSAGFRQEQANHEANVEALNEVIAELRARPETDATPARIPVCPHSNAEVEGGCEWKSRHDMGPSTMDLSQSTEEEINAMLEDVRVDDLAEQYRPRTYIRDICIKCGRTAERARPVDAENASDRITSWAGAPGADLRAFRGVGVGGTGE